MLYSQDACCGQHFQSLHTHERLGPQHLFTFGIMAVFMMLPQVDAEYPQVWTSRSLAFRGWLSFDILATAGWLSLSLYIYVVN